MLTHVLFFIHSRRPTRNRLRLISFFVFYHPPANRESIPRILLYPFPTHLFLLSRLRLSISFFNSLLFHPFLNERNQYLAMFSLYTSEPQVAFEIFCMFAIQICDSNCLSFSRRSEPSDRRRNSVQSSTLRT